MYLRFVKPCTFFCVLHCFTLLYGQRITPDSNNSSITNTLDTNNKDLTSSTVVQEPGEDDDEDENVEGEPIFLEYDEDYDEPVKPKNQTELKTGIIYTWGKWPKWNKCSRPCGGGVQTRIRNCIEKKQTGSELLITEFQPGTDGRKGCFGVLKKFRICNQKACVKAEDFRNQQCATYNKIPFRGKLYEWEGYTKEHHECELNCKPVDLNYYTTLGKWVTDGTPCSKPSVYYTHFYRGRAVCVEGICKDHFVNHNGRE